MKEVDPRLHEMLVCGGYVRINDNEAGARYVKGEGEVTVSGHMAIMSHHGFIKPYPVEKALSYGVIIMERICNLSSREVEHRNQRRPNYDIPGTRSF